jgi:hypothetical protein
MCIGETLSRGFQLMSTDQDARCGPAPTSLLAGILGHGRLSNGSKLTDDQGRL